MNFASDNQSGVCQRILQALVEAASGCQSSYGNDTWSQRAEVLLKETFDTDLRVFFVATGTAANCLALSALARPWQAVLCHAQAHIITDETSAPEFFTGGARLLPVATASGKLLADDLDRALARLPSARPHTITPAALSITQATENGLVYTPQELAALSARARDSGLHVHMDGARFANAVARLGCHPADLSARAGVDVLSLGASKSGALCAEAVVFFNTALAEDFDVRRKRAGQLVSKGRLFGAQYCGWLESGHWLELAGHANTCATQLAAVLSGHPAVRQAWPVEANELIVAMPRALHAHLLAAGVACYDWYPDSFPAGMALEPHEVPVRFVTSWSTTAGEIQALDAVLAATH